MNERGLLKYGHLQDENVIDRLVVNLPEDVRLYEDREEFFIALGAIASDYANYQLEKVYPALLGDVLNVLIRNLSVVDAPEIYERMRQDILANHQVVAERQLLTFLHEFHATLDAEIEAFRLGSTDKDSYAPYAFLVLRISTSANRTGKIPINFISHDSDYNQAYTNKLQELQLHGITEAEIDRVDECWVINDSRAYFLEYLKRIYTRAKHMQAFIDFCSECNWINEPIETFRTAGMIQAGEIGGTLFRYIAGADVHTAGFLLQAEYETPTTSELRSRVLSEDHVDIEAPVPYEGISSLRLFAVDKNVPTAIEELDVLSVTNTGDTPIKMMHVDGTGNPVDVAGISPIGTDESLEIAAKHFREVVTFVQVIL